MKHTTKASSDSVLRYYSAIGRRFREELDKVRLLVSHSGTIGAWIEDLLRDFLRDYLPARWAVGYGFVYAGEDLRSKQLDVVIWDAEVGTPILSYGAFAVLPPGISPMAIEVKSSLDAGKLRPAFSNCRQFMSACGPTPKPSYGVFAVTGSPQAEIANRIATSESRAHGTAGLPDIMVTLGKGVLVREPETYSPEYDGARWYREVFRGGNRDEDWGVSFLMFYAWVRDVLDRLPREFSPRYSSFLQAVTEFESERRSEVSRRLARGRPP